MITSPSETATTGAIGFCARVKAETAAEAVTRLKEELQDRIDGIKIPASSDETQYINPTNISVADIDEVNEIGPEVED